MKKEYEILRMSIVSSQQNVNFDDAMLSLRQ